MAQIINYKRLAHKIIDRTVQQYLEAHMLEVYLGRVTIDQIVAQVNHNLLTMHILMTKDMLGDVYDTIRLYGPEGENDTIWLVQNGGPTIYCPDCGKELAAA
jgi:hypothetical protein